MEVNIKRRLSFLLNFLVVNPLSLGHPTEAGTSDGSTSSTVAFACVLAIFFISIASVAAEESFENINNSLWMLMVIITVTGTIAMTLILFLTICCPSYGIIRGYQSENNGNRLEVAFLWFSGLGILLRTGTKLALNIDCVNDYPVLLDISIILSTILKIVYLLFQMAFLTHLRNVRLAGGVLINYLISVILLANCSILISYVMLKLNFIYIFKNENTTSLISLTNSSEEHCYWNSKFRKLSNDLRSFTLTASLIFLVLSSKFLIRLWSSTQPPSHVSNICNENEKECSGSIQQATSERPARSLFKTMKIVSFIVGILLNTPFFTMAILMKFIFRNNITTIKVFWDIFVIAYLAIAICVILVGINNLKLDRLKKLPIEMWDFLLLICMAGNVIMNILGCTSVLVCHVERPIIIFTKNILMLFLTYYHTMYITIARRIPSRVLCESVTIRFIHALIFCCLLGRWLLQTFLLSSQNEYMLKESQGCLFPNKKSWLTLQYFFIPLNTFYDFQSFVFYYGKL